ncbi:MAG TPA: hypothetical protein DFR83_28060 [Deltaproteobacteria bacterium]|nr:hypothetical protein [Deltaproteobacteria bacterium]
MGVERPDAEEVDMNRLLGLFVLAGMTAGMPALAKGKKKGWKNQTYLRPSLGGTTFTPETGDPVSVVSVGAVAGIQYWERGRRYPKMRGHARASGAYVMSGGPLSGFEARLGNFMGPTWGKIGFTVGPDFFYNQYQYGPTTIPATGGVGTPLTVDSVLDPFTLYAGLEPSWYFNDVRERRDWVSQDGLPGFGHEFAYFAGAAISIGSWTLGGSIRHSMTAYGNQNSYGITANVQGALGKGGKRSGKGRR